MKATLVVTIRNKPHTFVKMNSVYRIPIIEQNHVYKVYTEIADEFNDTRYSVWSFVKEFLYNKKAVYGIDIGCGNGKNMINENMVGVDICEKMLQFAAKRDKPVMKACCCDLPFIDNTFDYAMSISVVHHMGTHERRLKAVQEMIRVIKPGNECMFNVWSVEDQERRVFLPGDNMVTWKSKPTKDKKVGEIVHDRFYHVYDHALIHSFVSQIYGVHDVRVFNEHGNWVVRMRKNVI